MIINIKKVIVDVKKVIITPKKTSDTKALRGSKTIKHLNNDKTLKHIQTKGLLLSNLFLNIS